jgi:hypothetical protein
MGDPTEDRDALHAKARRLRDAGKALVSPLLELTSAMEAMERFMTGIAVDLRMVDYSPFSHLGAVPAAEARKARTNETDPPPPVDPKPLQRSRRQPVPSALAQSPPDAAGSNPPVREPAHWGDEDPLRTSSDPPVFSFRRSRFTPGRETVPAGPARGKNLADDRAAQAALGSGSASQQPTSAPASGRDSQRLKEALLASGARSKGAEVLSGKQETSTTAGPRATGFVPSPDARSGDSGSATDLMERFADELLQTARNRVGSTAPAGLAETGQSIDTGRDPESAFGGRREKNPWPSFERPSVHPRGHVVDRTANHISAPSSPRRLSPLEVSFPGNAMQVMDSLTEMVLSRDQRAHPRVSRPMSDGSAEARSGPPRSVMGEPGGIEDPSSPGGTLQAGAQGVSPAREVSPASGNAAAEASPSRSSFHPPGATESPSGLTGTASLPARTQETRLASQGFASTAPTLDPLSPAIHHADADGEALASLINEALVAQARRHGVDLS